MFCGVLISDASHRVGSADHKSGGHENQDWMVIWGVCSVGFQVQERSGGPFNLLFLCPAHLFNLLVLSATVLVSHFSVLSLHYNLYCLIGPPAWQADCGAECRMKEHVLKTKVACGLGSYLGSWLGSEVLGPLKPPGQL